MKLYKYFIFLPALLLFTVQSKAQQTIDPTLEVKRDFDAKLLEITKGKLYTNFHDSLGRFDLSFDYSIFDSPIKNLYEFSPLPSAQIEKEKEIVQPTLFIRAGTNIPLNPYGSIYIQPRLGKNFSLVLNGAHNSFISKLPTYTSINKTIEKGESEIAAPSSKTDLGIDFRYNWSRGEIGVEAKYNNRNNSYYGFNQEMLNTLEYQTLFKGHNNQSFMRDSMSNSTDIIGAGFYLKSTNKNPNSFYYNVKAHYSQLSGNETHLYFPIYGSSHLNGSGFAKNKLEEKHLNLALTAGAGFATFNKILAGVKYEASDSRFSDSLNRSNLEIHPRYSFKKGRWDFNLGFKYNMLWEKDSTNYNIYFSSSAQLEVVNKKLWIYGLIDGKNNFMNYRKMIELNPWISPATDIQNIEQPVIARVGVKGIIKERVSFNIYGGYYEYNNQLYFYTQEINSYSKQSPVNSFGAIYKHQKRTGLGAELSYHSKSFEGAVNANLYSFKDKNNMTDNHFNYSPFEVKAIGRYNWRERIIAKATFNYIQKRPGLTDENLSLSSSYPASGIHPTIFIPSYALLDLNLSYVYNKNLTFFIQLNNILSSKQFEYTNYSMPGFNGGAGLSFKL